MRNVIYQVSTEQYELQLKVIRMEIDYELVSLHDAMEDKNERDMYRTKQRLGYLVNKLQLLQWKIERAK
ncbi:MAG TPA: hypothetical protein VK067_03035 [Pseudogracilibacillus sp.]|nr:hypothetical protein [Pseudogracilibacillus sp.]